MIGLPLAPIPSLPIRPSPHLSIRPTPISSPSITHFFLIVSSSSKTSRAMQVSHKSHTSLTQVSHKSHTSLAQSHLSDVYDPNVLSIDRRVSQVQPSLRRVDDAIKPVALALAASAIALRLLAPSDPYEQFSQQYLSQLGGDERLAYSEQQRAQQRGGNKPSYCDSRYYKAIAGGDSSGACN